MVHVFISRGKIFHPVSSSLNIMSPRLPASLVVVVEDIFEETGP